MRYVYLLVSLSHPNQRYVGSTDDLKRRLAEHNAGKSPHTSKYVPWKCVVAIERQASHHEIVTFQSELTAILDEHGFDYDRRELWG